MLVRCTYFFCVAIVVVQATGTDDDLTLEINKTDLDDVAINAITLCPCAGVEIDNKMSCHLNISLFDNERSYIEKLCLSLKKIIPNDTVKNVSSLLNPDTIEDEVVITTTPIDELTAENTTSTVDIITETSTSIEEFTEDYTTSTVGPITETTTPVDELKAINSTSSLDTLTETTTPIDELTADHTTPQVDLITETSTSIDELTADNTTSKVDLITESSTSIDEHTEDSTISTIDTITETPTPIDDLTEDNTTPTVDSITETDELTAGTTIVAIIHGNRKVSTTPRSVQPAVSTTPDDPYIEYYSTTTEKDYVVPTAAGNHDDGSYSTLTLIMIIILSFGAGILCAIICKVIYNRFGKRSYTLPPEQNIQLQA